ncbi:MAG: hypothetical protein WAW13_00950 [Minisyncoccia bacterium]
MKLFARSVTYARMSLMCLLTWYSFVGFVEAQTIQAYRDTSKLELDLSGFPTTVKSSESFLKIGVSPHTESFAYHQPSYKKKWDNSLEINGWSKLAEGMNKPKAPFSLKEFFQVKYQYFVVGIYNESGIGLGPMIEINLTRKVRVWALAPIISKNDDSKSIAIGFVIDL